MSPVILANSLQNEHAAASSSHSRVYPAMRRIKLFYLDEKNPCSLLVVRQNKKINIFFKGSI